MSHRVHIHSISFSLPLRCNKEIGTEGLIYSLEGIPSTACETSFIGDLFMTMLQSYGIMPEPISKDLFLTGIINVQRSSPLLEGTAFHS